MNQEDFDREMTEIIGELTYMEKLLQKKVDVNQKRGWNMKKPIRWPVVQLFVQELRNNLRKMKKKEKLREVEFRYKPLTTQERVHYCEPEQGDILGEDDIQKRSIEDLISCLENEEEERLEGSLMSSLKSSRQKMDMLISMADRHNVFVSNILCP